MLAIIGGVTYFLFDKYSQLPNEPTRVRAQAILKFPYALSWQIKNSKNVCVFSKNICNQPITIVFSTQRDWPEVYKFYRQQMESAGWKTNSLIVSSIPTSIVFTNNFNCEAELTKYDPVTNIISKPKDNQFEFSLVCPSL